MITLKRTADNTDLKLIQSPLQSGEKRTWCLCEGPEELLNTSLTYFRHSDANMTQYYNQDS